MIGHVIPDPLFTPSASLTQRDLAPSERAQRQQFLDSYVRVTGHEPSSAEIADFERRHLARSRPGGT